jgi:hypothetical protein
MVIYVNIKLMIFVLIVLYQFAPREVLRSSCFCTTSLNQTVCGSILFVLHARFIKLMHYGEVISLQVTHIESFLRILMGFVIATLH